MLLLPCPTHVWRTLGDSGLDAWTPLDAVGSQKFGHEAWRAIKQWGMFSTQEGYPVGPGKRAVETRLTEVSKNRKTIKQGWLPQLPLSSWRRSLGVLTKTRNNKPAGGTSRNQGGAQKERSERSVNMSQPNTPNPNRLRAPHVWAGGSKRDASSQKAKGERRTENRCNAFFLFFPRVLS